MNLNLKPSDIRYSQDSISKYFIDRTTLIGKTLDDICEGRCKISDVPRISVKMKNDHWVTSDNRRLWVFKHVERLGKCTEIPVLKARNIPRKKRTSDNHGASIIIRGHPGGIWHSKPTPQPPASSTSNIYSDETQYDLHEVPQSVAIFFRQNVGYSTNLRYVGLTSARMSPRTSSLPTRVSPTHDRHFDIKSKDYDRYRTQTKDTVQVQREIPVIVHDTINTFGQLIDADRNDRESQQCVETLGSGRPSETYDAAAKKPKREMQMYISLKPSEIRYSMATIRNNFHDRIRSIGDTLDEICEGRCTISRIPTIYVMQMNGRWVTADNRRLWVFKHLERLGKCTEIRVQETNYIDPHKLNSLNGGTSVKIRGGCNPGGSWYLKPTPQPPPPSTSNIYLGQKQYRLQDERQLGANLFGQHIEQPTNRFSLQKTLFPTKLSQAIDRNLDIESRYGRYGTETHETDEEQRKSPISVQQTINNFGQKKYQRNQSEANGLNIGHAREGTAFAFRKPPTQVMGFESSGYGSSRIQTSNDFSGPQRITDHGKTTEVNLIRQQTETYEGPKLNSNAVPKLALRHSKAIQKSTVDGMDTPLRYLSLRDAQTDDERIGRERQIDRGTLGRRRSSDKDVNSAKKAVKKPTMAHRIIAGFIQERLQVTAIDFGTTFSGYAFSFRNDFKEDPLKIVTNQWRTGSNQSISLKTSSCILFDPEQKFHSFGFDAEDMYAKLASEERHIGWYYFKQFKMLLYENKDLSRRIPIKDDLGNAMPALTVFAESIKFLKHHFLDSCKDRQYGLNEDEIHWVLTVPAIWDDSAKQFMREAAIQAGIDSRHLSLALEPEAASMFCKYMPVNKIQGAKGGGLSCFQPGTRYMVLDAGGGTVDITVHETQRDHTVRELFKANGGPWGGTKVDEAFHKFLVEISSVETLRQFKLTHMEDYLDIMREFEIKKSMTSPNLDQRITFKIPVSFHETYASLHGKELRISRIVKEPLKQNITFTGDKLRVQPEVIQGFFTEACETIVSHLKGIFSHRKVSNTDTVLMVGGFSESRMLQDAIRRNFPDKHVIIPAEAGLAVLKGAVIFGHNPTAITSRISRFTYGVCTNTRFRARKHPIERYFEAEGKAYCSDVFDIHVNIGDEVEDGTSFQTKTYTPIFSTASHLFINLYTTDIMNPSYTDETGCQMLGSINVDLSNLMQTKSDKEVEVTMKYGGTELHVEAKVVKTGQKVNASFEFL